MNKKESIEQIIRETWSNSDIISTWNERCEDENCMDDIISSMDEFEEEAKSTIDSMGVGYFLDRIQYGNFRYSDDFWGYNGYGNFISFSDPIDDSDSPIDMDELINWLIENGDYDISVGIDTEELKKDFVDEYYCGDDKASEAIDYLINEEGFDLLMDNWDEIKAEVDFVLAKDSKD